MSPVTSSEYAHFQLPHCDGAECVLVLFRFSRTIYHYDMSGKRLSRGRRNEKLGLAPSKARRALPQPTARLSTQRLPADTVNRVHHAVGTRSTIQRVHAVASGEVFNVTWVVGKHTYSLKVRRGDKRRTVGCEIVDTVVWLTIQNDVLCIINSFLPLISAPKALEAWILTPPATRCSSGTEVAGRWLGLRYNLCGYLRFKLGLLNAKWA